MKIIDYLSDQDIDFTVKHHETGYTAQEEAAAQHISGHVFAKTVVVKAGDDYVVLVLPASYRVDFDRAEVVLGTRPRLAEEKEMGRLFPDADLGAEPPFGSQYGLRTIVDESLADHQQIAVRAGSHKEVVLMSYEDFVRLEQPRVAKFARPEM